MTKLQAAVSVQLVVAVLLLATTIPFAHADFHVVNLHKLTGEQELHVVPLSGFNCAGLEQNKLVMANAQYPDCGASEIRIPDGQCGWVGVTIKPACYDNYFGKLIGGVGEDQGYCDWNDSKSTFSFACEGLGPVFDRLVCYSDMCGKSLSDVASI